MSTNVTLAQYRLQVGDNVLLDTVIDDFIKNNYVLNTIEFDRVVAPVGGGALAHSYNVSVTNPTAAFRALYDDYTSVAAEVEQKTTYLKTLGAKFDVDRVEAANTSIVARQMSHAAKGLQAKWNDAFINGDTGTTAAEFDGLAEIVEDFGTAISGAAMDWSDLSTTAKALAVCDNLDELLDGVGGEGSAILVNPAAFARIRSAARAAGYLTPSENNFGASVMNYNGVPIVNLGAKAGSNDPIISTTAGATDIYCVRFGLDAVHAIAPAGLDLIEARVPDRNQGTPTLSGWVEITSAPVVKTKTAVAKLEGVTIASGS